MKKLRILILTHNYPISSQERRNAGIFVHDFAKELTRNGVNVYIFCPSASKNTNKVDGIPVHWFKWGKKGRSLRELKVWNPYDLCQMMIFFFKGINASLKYANKLNPDLCISMWAVPSGVFAYFIKRNLGIPYVVWVLGSDAYVYLQIPLFGLIVQKVLQGAKYLFADGIELSRLVSNITKRKCLFLQSVTAFHSPTQGMKKEIGGKQTVLTFLGRMESEKGPDLLLEALLRIKDEIHNFKINFLGDGSLLKLLKTKVKEEGLTPYINFYGNVDDKRKITHVLYNSHWVVIPSRSDSIPLVFSEAMKIGVPVIASSLLDLKYLINKYKVGLYFKTGDVNRLSTLIKSLPAQNSNRKTFAKNTHYAAQFFSLERSARQFLETWNNEHRKY